MPGQMSFNPRTHGYLMGDNLLRRELLVWYILLVGNLVCRFPALVEMDAGPEEEALSLLGEVVTVWSPVILPGPGVEGLVKL